MKGLAPRAALAVVGVGLVACPPSLDDPAAFEPAGCPASFSADALFQSNCVSPGCHRATTPAAGLDLASPGAFERMYGAASVCGPLIISPAGPNQSLLVAKLEGTVPCGARMPLGRAPLSASDILCVEQWITNEIAVAGPPLGTGGAPSAGGAPGTGGAPGDGGG